jgi:hypothetical protein
VSYKEHLRHAETTGALYDLLGLLQKPVVEFILLPHLAVGGMLVGKRKMLYLRQFQCGGVAARSHL